MVHRSISDDSRVGDTLYMRKGLFVVAEFRVYYSLHDHLHTKAVDDCGEPQFLTALIPQYKLRMHS
jgi:hypothetical protein